MDASTNIRPDKAFAFEVIEKNTRAIATLGDAIFYFAELGMQEHESARLMTEILAEAGFTVERGISGFPTGFLATCGSGTPVVAMHTEYDANPNNSQAAGVAEHKAIVDGAPGHCEGHNVNAAVMVAAAIAAKRAMDKHGLKGTLKVFGAPAEEQLVSRPYYVRDGLFADVDVAFHDHIAGEFKTEYGLLQTAAVNSRFTFRGETAHSSMSPWQGRDALDGVVLMDMGLAQYREHMRPTMRAHRVITDGGDQPNVIPAKATVWWCFRDVDADGARALFEQGRRIAQGAAMMTNTEVEVEVMSAVWPTRGNQVMAEIVQRNIELVGMPAWTADEVALARAVQEKAGVKPVGLATQIGRLDGPGRQIAASNDCGDVSWAVPMARLQFPSNLPHVNYHHWGAGVTLATSIAHKGAVVGAKALAASVLDIFAEPALAERAKAKFKEELGGKVYRPLIPADQKPPVELNHALMERFRPAMRAHYVAERPRFV
ncbi:MAG: amidohydrolase [Alphaproteobacteria bacterium]|nr:amidohydrolase [Alphaproteobacteria bacterium]